MKSSAPIDLYLHQMLEIKRRMKVIDYFLFAGGHALYKPTTIESTCLQFRHVLELVAFGSLCANRAAYAAVHNDFSSHWNAELLLKDLSRVNSDFYPVPKIELRSTETGVKNHLEDLKDGFLTKAEFVAAYKKCGAMMHARNPYGSKTGHHFFEKALPEWREKLIKLLNNHSVKVLGHPGFWLIHMHELHDDEVRGYEFIPA
jgi:hypothetical protein